LLNGEAHAANRFNRAVAFVEILYFDDWRGQVMILMLVGKLNSTSPERAGRIFGRSTSIRQRPFDVVDCEHAYRRGVRFQLEACTFAQSGWRRRQWGIHRVVAGPLKEISRISSDVGFVDHMAIHRKFERDVKSERLGGRRLR
jgi:hypothetical protein